MKSFWINSGIWEKVIISVTVAVILSILGYGTKAALFIENQPRVDEVQNSCIKALQVNAEEVQESLTELNKRNDQTQDDQKELANQLMAEFKSYRRDIEQLRGVSNQILDKLDERPVIWSKNEIDSLVPINTRVIYLDDGVDLYVNCEETFATKKRELLIR